MPTATIGNVYAVGVAVNLLSADTTVLLSALTGPLTGDIVDDDGTLGGGDDGVSTFNGHAITYIGSGTSQAGIAIGGLTIPLGPSVSTVAFAAGGVTYLYFPDGTGSILSGVALVPDLTSAPYDGITPVCFTEGTLIATPEGEVPIESLAAGDPVLDMDGRIHPVRWIGRRRQAIPLGLGQAFEKWLPVVVRAHSFGPGQPHRDTRFSQNHRVLLGGAQLEVLTGEPQMLAPVKFLLGPGIEVDRSVREVTYFHILCGEHVILVANGLCAESLMRPDLARNGEDRAAWEEALCLFPEVAGDPAARMRAAFPVLRRHEARLLTACTEPA